MQRKIRVLVGKPGLDGHDRGAKVVAAALRDAGMEVIYTGLHQTPEQIVEAALQEDVDVIALSILSGAHMTLFREVLGLMKQRGLGDRLVTGGGIIPAEDMETLANEGVGRLFGPGSSTQDIADYIRSWFADKHGADALTPLPPPPAAATLVLPESGREPQAARQARRAPPPGPGSRRAAAAKPAGRAPSAGRGPARPRPAAKRASAKRRATARGSTSRRVATRRGAKSPGAARRGATPARSRATTRGTRAPRSR